MPDLIRLAERAEFDSVFRLLVFTLDNIHQTNRGTAGYRAPGGENREEPENLWNSK